MYKVKHEMQFTFIGMLKMHIIVGHVIGEVIVLFRDI